LSETTLQATSLSFNTPFARRRPPAFAAGDLPAGGTFLNQARQKFQFLVGVVDVAGRITGQCLAGFCPERLVV
jgi:hypothetical protein